ncbi:MAG TPA: hypothetical protein VNS49_19275, partial [Streptomyces sp.]|nr:hypothetical protein [Streptomyces sp.]
MDGHGAHGGGPGAATGTPRGISRNLAPLRLPARYGDLPTGSVRPGDLLDGDLLDRDFIGRDL